MFHTDYKISGSHEVVLHMPDNTQHFVQPGVVEDAVQAVLQRAVDVSDAERDVLVVDVEHTAGKHEQGVVAVLDVVFGLVADKWPVLRIVQHYALNDAKYGFGSNLKRSVKMVLNESLSELNLVLDLQELCLVTHVGSAVAFSLRASFPLSFDVL